MRRSVRTRIVAGLLLGGLLPGLTANRASGQNKAPEPLKLKVGDQAPDFTMQYFDGSDRKDVHLSDYRGKKNVVLAFYIFAFTGG
jgi:cytochrome oxidase Cu insertion factor (SCO1/SenC/PrrC family)